MRNPYQKKRTQFIGQIVFVILLIIANLSAFGWLMANGDATLQEECEQEAKEKFDHLNILLHDALFDAQYPAENFVKQLYDTKFDYSTEENVYQVMEQLMDEHPQISGAIMAFEDWVYPQYADKNGFGPLVRRNEEGGTSRLQIGEFRDFRNQNEWYIRQRRNPVSEWSRPFFSDDGVMIVTYTIPLFSPEGRYIGGFGIDIDLTDLAIEVEQYKPYPTTTVTVIDENLTILMHPNKEYIINKKLPEVMPRVGLDPHSAAFEEAYTKMAGKVYAEMGTRKLIFFYGPVPGTHWRSILYCPQDEIYGPIEQKMNLYIGIFSFTTLLLIGLLVFVIIRFHKFRKSYFLMYG